MQFILFKKMINCALNLYIGNEEAPKPQIMGLRKRTSVISVI